MSRGIMVRWKRQESQEFAPYHTGGSLSRVCADEICEKDHIIGTEKPLTRGADFGILETGRTGLAGREYNYLVKRHYRDFIFSPL